MSENNEEHQPSDASPSGNGSQSGHDHEEHAPRVARSFSSQSINEPVHVVESEGNPPNRGKGHAIPHARRMGLSLIRLDAWSVAKVSFLMGVAGGIIQIAAVALLWILLNLVGVFNQITQIVSSTGLNANGFNLADMFSLSTVLSAVTILSIVEIVLATVLATIYALLYNVVSSLVGGVHVTLGDD